MQISSRLNKTYITPSKGAKGKSPARIGGDKSKSSNKFLILEKVTKVDKHRESKQPLLALQVSRNENKEYENSKEMLNKTKKIGRVIR